MDLRLLTFAVVTTLLPCLPVGADVLAWMGDAIGSDPTEVTGQSASSASAGFGANYTTANLGTPAFAYQSDGRATLNKLRAVTALNERADRGINWEATAWGIRVWELSAYHSNGAPLIEVDLGNTPSNWSGFKHDSGGRTVPDTPAFGTPANTFPQNSYEMVFDLASRPEFSDPLPVGDYIIGFFGDNFPNTQGESGVIATTNGIGPTPYYSATGRTSPIEPGLVHPRLINNSDFRWAMALYIDRPVEVEFFEYDGQSGQASVSFNGFPNTAYRLLQNPDLDFSAATELVPLASPVGTIEGNRIVTDSTGNATVSFDLGVGPRNFFIITCE